MYNQTINKGKTIAIISYITWIGTLIAFIINNEKQNSFASFHIKQMIGLSLFSLVNSFLISPYASPFTTAVISLGLFILWIIGLIGAIKGEAKKIPLFGDIFQDWFKNIA